MRLVVRAWFVSLMLLVIAGKSLGAGGHHIPESADDHGPDLPTVGSSLFDKIYSTTTPSGDAKYDVPYPLERLLDKVNKRGGEFAHTLFPFSRSLQRPQDLSYDPIANPRLVFAPTKWKTTHPSLSDTSTWAKSSGMNDMKSTNLTVALFVFAASVAQAAPLKFSIECGQLQDVRGNVLFGAPSYKINKLTKKVSGRWQNFFELEEKSADGTIRILPLEPAGSGDEDYDEFNVIGEGSPVQGVYLNNRFKWAALINDKGRSVNRCE